MQEVLSESLRSGWYIGGKVLRQRTFNRVQIKAVDTLTPWLRKVDRFLPWGGQSLVGVGVKPG